MRWPSDGTVLELRRHRNLLLRPRACGSGSSNRGAHGWVWLFATSVQILTSKLKPAKEADLASVRLGQWIDERIFGFAKQERLIGFFYYCLRLGWIKSNPAVLLGRIRADGPPTNYFPVVEHVKKSADEDSC